MPTVKQMSACMQVCQSLSNFYQDIKLFRYDSGRKEIYLLAGYSIEITIFATGLWEFDNATD